MKTTCLKLALFILLGTTLLSLFSQKALAKDSYGITWTVQATPSAVTVDPSNNIYYAGYLARSSSGLVSVEMNPYYTLDPVHQVSDPQIATTDAIFLSKLNANLTYDKSYIIEADNSKIVNNQNISVSLTKIATDSAQNIYLLGSFNGNVDFDPTGGMDFHSSNGETWPFLLKINANGTYGGTYLWQDNNLTIRDMIIDKSDNIYLLGQTSNTGLTDINVNLNPLGGNDPHALNPGDTLGFYTRLATGTPYTYDYSRTFKNTSSQHLEVDHIASTSAGSIFLYGVFNGTMNFNGSGGTDNKTSSSNSDDLYLSKYDAGGTYLATYLIGNSGAESAGTLGIDNNDNVYFSGGFNGTVNFNSTGGTDDKTAILPGRRFLSKLNNDGTYGYTLIWNSNTLTINKISFDNANLMYLVGTSTGNTNYDPIGASDSQIGFGGNDAFMTIINPDNTYNYTYVWGGNNNEKATDAAFDSLNNFYITGSTESINVNFDPTSNIVTTLPSVGGEWGYLTEFSSQQVVVPSPTPTPGPSDNSNSSNNSSGNQGFTCTNHVPAAPRIFQIAATREKSTLNFVPSIDQQDTYTISYGLYSDAEMYNVTFNYSDKSGAIPYTINALAGNMTYYFKVRANNGCMAGNWSQTLSIKTPYSASGK
jgi:hypothetical protein